MGAINTSTITHLYPGDNREYGADFGAGSSGGAPVFSPVAGKVIAYEPSTNSWEPGRLLIQAANGAVVGIGHITTLVKVGDIVSNGQQVGAVGNNGGNSHIEVMYSPSGDLSRGGFTNYAPSADFLTGLGKLVAGNPGSLNTASLPANASSTTTVGPGKGWSIGPWQVASGAGLHRFGWSAAGVALIVFGAYLMFRRDVNSAVGSTVGTAAKVGAGAYAINKTTEKAAKQFHAAAPKPAPRGPSTLRAVQLDPKVKVTKVIDTNPRVINPGTGYQKLSAGSQGGSS